MSSRERVGNSELEEWKERYYMELRDEKVKIQSNGKYLHCPYCPDHRRNAYYFEEQIWHSSRIGRESKGASVRDKARHLGLLKYLDRYGDKQENVRPRRRSLERFQDSKSSQSYRETKLIDSNDPDGIHSGERECEGIYQLIEDGILRERAAETTVAVKCDPSTVAKSVKSPAKGTLPNLKTKSQVHVQSKMKVDEDGIVWPWMVLVANIPVEYKNGKYVGESGRKLREELKSQGYDPVKVHPLWNHRGHSGFAVVEFDGSWGGFNDAMMLEKTFEGNGQGKRDWKARSQKGDKLYAWIARDEEYLSKGLIGEYLSKNEDLKTVSEIETEDKVKGTKLVSSLKNELVLKSKRCEQMEKKISRTEALVGKVMKQKEEIVEKFNDKIKMMQQEAHDQLQHILTHHRSSNLDLEARREELEMREKELTQRQAINQKEKRMLDHKKEMNERAIVEQKKADEKMMNLAEEQKNRNSTKSKHWNWKVKRMKGAIEVMRHMTEEGDAEAQNKKKFLEEKLKDEEEELDVLDRMNQNLIVKEKLANDELQEARKKLIHGLPDGRGRAIICVKRMGELDENPFVAAAKRKYSKEEAEEKGMELCSLWEEYLRDPSRHPYKVIVDGENAKVSVNFINLYQQHTLFVFVHGEFCDRHAHA
ncbi:hypothetical protein M9H77_06583 [Catharanthus roseus]|uniref:Uncharacterized protein n=1 Tax=Catharanthus roseus TaxID=4058 RepID=A0ACC0BSQ4_CATRO|nr:hypothetical protein M9H77_06583 [Catharanthus roseus]